MYWNFFEEHVVWNENQYHLLFSTKEQYLKEKFCFKYTDIIAIKETKMI